MTETLEVSDQSLPDQPAVAVQFDDSKVVDLQSAGSGSRSWLVPVKVSGLTLNAALSRYARVKLGQNATVFGYTLTNRPSSIVDFAVTAKPVWNVRGNNPPMDIVVQAHDQPVIGLQIAQSTLIEQSVGTQIGASSLQLCSEPPVADSCKEPLPIAAQTNRTVYLSVKDADLSNGVFKGSVSFTADGRSEPKPVEIVLKSSSWCAGFFGLIIIVVGVVGAWFVNVYGRLVVLRLSALEAAATVRESLDSLLTDVTDFEKQTNISLPKLKTCLQARASELTVKSLETVLPSTNAYYKQFDDTALKATLSKGTTALDIYTVIVKQGINRILGYWKSANVANQQAVASAASALDVGDVLDASTARTLVDGAVKQAASAATRTVGALAALGSGGGGAPVPKAAELSSHTILVRLGKVNFALWAAYIALVVISGAVTLIFLNPGFGTLLDFVYCLFWGFGLPTTLDKLQQLTVAGVSSSLSVSVPK